MKIGGVVVTTSDEVLVLPRVKGPDIVIKAVCVDMSDYEEFYPRPKMPQRVVKGGVEGDADSPAYKGQLTKWGQQRFAYMVVNSIIPSDIEWDSVDPEDPASCVKWIEELKKGGLNDAECTRIINCVLTANSLNEAKLKEARDAFLLGQTAEQAKSSGQDTEQPNTPSGEPAKDSESDPQE